MEIEYLSHLRVSAICIFVLQRWGGVSDIYNNFCYSCVKMLISYNVKMLSFKQNIIDILFVLRCFQLVSKSIGFSVL